MKTSPHIVSNNKPSRVTVSVPAAYKAAIERAANAHGTTIADFVKAALNAALANEPTTGVDPDFELLSTRTMRHVRLLDVLFDVYDLGIFR